MRAVVLFLTFVAVFGISEEEAIQQDFDFNIADDFAQLAWDSYDQSPADEPGDKNGRDLNWIVKKSLWCGHLTEGYIYKHETAMGSDGKEICAIGIQGTDNLSDAIQDIKVDVVEVEDKKTGKHFWIHRGALGRLKCFTDQPEIMQIVDTDCSRDALYLVGHSLGGAIVQIWALALLDGFKSVPHEHRDWEIDLDPIDHNVQAYTFSGFKPFSLPFDVTHFPLTEPVINGVNWYQDNIPCPESLAGPHLHRIFTSTRSSTGQFIVDYIVVNHLLALFRFCSQGYELDLNTGVLTKDDLYAPDFNAATILYDLGYHSLTNHIPAIHMPSKVLIQRECSTTPNQENDWIAPGASVTKKVRCCSSTECTSRVNGWASCSGSLTYSAAQKFCTDMDMHVCSSEEQMQMCCEHDSCWYNNNEVWTSDVVEKTPENGKVDYPKLEQQDPLCRGHGCEATKYGILYFDNEDHPHDPNAPAMPGGQDNLVNNMAHNNQNKEVQPQQEIQIAKTEPEQTQLYHENVLENMVAQTEQVFQNYLEKENRKNQLVSKRTLYIIYAGVILGLLMTYCQMKKKTQPANSYLEFVEEEL